MEIKNLNRKEIGDVYQLHMQADFPAEELKPLSMILDAYENGFYRVEGFYQDNQLIAYACIATMPGKADHPVLLDYLAVVRGRRDEGWGSQVLTKLREAYPHGILIECEAVHTAIGPDDRANRERRIRFYTKNGARIQPFDVTLFGVRFSILLLGGTNETDARQSLLDLYSIILGEERKQQFMTVHENNYLTI